MFWPTLYESGLGMYEMNFALLAAESKGGIYRQKM